jgi:hypothetical protein
MKRTNKPEVIARANAKRKKKNEESSRARLSITKWVPAGRKNELAGKVHKLLDAEILRHRN